LTVSIECDPSTRSINHWIGINIQIEVGTISHHLWDHDSFVDVYPGPFLITSGTIWDHKSWSLFFRLLGKTRLGPRCASPGLLGAHCSLFKRVSSVVSGQPKGGVMRTWQSPYEIIGDGCDRDAGGHLYQPLDCFILRELLARLRLRPRLWTRSRGGSQSHYLRAWCLHLRPRLWTRSRGGSQSPYLRAWCLHTECAFDGQYQRIYSENKRLHLESS